MEAEEDETILIEINESVLVCQICMERFQSPRILPCQHTFCKACVISLVKKHCFKDASLVKSGFPCPNCRRDCKIRSASLEEAILLKPFQENLLLKTLLTAKTKPQVSTQHQSNNNKRLQIIQSAHGPNNARRLASVLKQFKQFLEAMDVFMDNWIIHSIVSCCAIKYCVNGWHQISILVNSLVGIMVFRNIIRPRGGTYGAPELDVDLRRINELLSTMEKKFTVPGMLNIAEQITNAPCYIIEKETDKTKKGDGIFNKKLSAREIALIAIIGVLSALVIFLYIA